MQISRHAVFTVAPERAGAVARQRLLILAGDGGSHLVGQYSGPGQGRLRRDWLRSTKSEAEATAIFDRVAQEIWGENGPLYPVPDNATALIARLAAQGESGTRGQPLPRGAVPTAPARQRATSWQHLRTAANSPSTAFAFLPAGAERAFAALDATGHARLLLPDETGQVLESIAPGDLAEADALLPERPWWNETPVLPSTTFDGFVQDLSTLLTNVGTNNAAGKTVGDFVYWVLDLVRYRGVDVTDRPLAERLSLRDQALAELATAGRLPPRWRAVAHFTRPSERASLTDPALVTQAAPHPLLAARDLQASYRSGAGDLRTVLVAEALA